jgi:hypothetical protein
MSLAAGAKLGPYEIIAPLGAGGMGEVYRARDTKLGRDVAIKVLPAAFSADADRLHRFEQEACAAGALNHPNILVIYHVDTYEGAPYIVSELLEGETLRQRLGATLGVPMHRDSSVHGSAKTSLQDAGRGSSATSGKKKPDTMTDNLSWKAVPTIQRPRDIHQRIMPQPPPSCTICLLT